MLNMCHHWNFQNKYIVAAASEKEAFRNVLKTIVLRSSHGDVFFNIGILNLWSNSLRNTCDGVQFLAISCYTFLLLTTSKESYIFLHHFAEQLLWNTSRKLLPCSEKPGRCKGKIHNNLTNSRTSNFLKKQRNEKVNFYLTHCIQFTHCFNKVFSMSLRSTEQLFVERPLNRWFLQELL